MTTQPQGTGVWHMDTEEEYENLIEELENNPDATDLGRYDMVQDIYEELEGQGFTEEQVATLSHNRYGTCLEIIEYTNEYRAFIVNL